MQRTHRFQWLVAALMVGGAAWGLLHLFALRFQSGDIYPPYSSQRDDPLGTGVLYTGLEELPGVTVSRHVRPLDRLTADANTTVILPALEELDAYALDDEDWQTLYALAAEGGRVVISAAASSGFRKHDDDFDDEESTNAPAIEAERKDGRCARCGRRDCGRVSTNGPARWTSHWGFLLRRETNDFDRLGSVAVRLPGAGDAASPATLPWRGSQYFDDATNLWRQVYTRDGLPVLMERTLGAGTLICLADSYLLSNEAMLRDRQPELLAWLVGDARHVIFDESHFGILSKPSVGTLLRRHGLQGALAGVALLMLLFAWREVSPLVPLRAAPGGAVAPIRGRDSQAGLVNLLRRSIPPGQVIARCVELWTEAGVSRGADREAAVRRLVAEAGARAAATRTRGTPDPAQLYRAISALLKERK